jgi:hypothetical protein
MAISAANPTLANRTRPMKFFVDTADVAAIRELPTSAWSTA